MISSNISKDYFLSATIAIATIALIFLTLLTATAADVMETSVSENRGSKNTWTVNDTFKVAVITAVDVSPDGRRVAYAVKRAIMTTDESEYRSQIYLADIDGNNTIQFTQGNYSNDNPQWSPDGKRVAFTSTRSGKPQIWVIPVGGGEAVQLTDMETEIAMFKWSPDGKSISFLTSDPQTEEQKRAAEEKDDALVVDEDVYVTGQPKVMIHLWTVSTEKNSSGKYEAQRLTEGNFSVSSWDWSPDGRSISFLYGVDPDYFNGTLAMVDLDGLEVTTLAQISGAPYSLSYSPDGRFIAFSTCDVYNVKNIFIVPSSGGQTRVLAEGLDMCTLYDGALHGGSLFIGWSKDGKSVYAIEGKGTESQILAMPVDGNSTEVLFKAGAIGSVRMNQQRDMLGLVVENSSSPAEAYVLKLADFRLLRVSNVNGDLPLQWIGKTDVIRWNSSDEMMIEGLLIYPADYQPGNRYPLLVEAHGGPAMAFQQFFPGSTSWPICSAGTFSSQGYFLLRPNIRGSIGYGPEFARANFRDLGGMDFQDLMAGVNHLIDEGLVDSDRLGIFGQSYGGYMAAWAVTQTDRFKAAVMIDGISDLISSDGTSDIPYFNSNHLGCNFWDNFSLHLEHSPIYHVENVSTPILILHGAEDVKCPTGQGMEFYSALKKRNVTVQMVLYPRSGHLPSEPKLRRDMHQRELEWFNRYVPANT